jgi:hypothetical protein
MALNAIATTHAFTSGAIFQLDNHLDVPFSFEFTKLLENRN